MARGKSSKSSILLIFSLIFLAHHHSRNILDLSSSSSKGIAVSFNLRTPFPHSLVFNKHCQIRSRRCWHSNLLSTKSHYSLLLLLLFIQGWKWGWLRKRTEWDLYRRRRVVKWMSWWRKVGDGGWDFTSKSFLIKAVIWFWQLNIIIIIILPFSSLRGSRAMNDITFNGRMSWAEWCIIIIY